MTYRMEFLLNPLIGEHIRKCRANPLWWSPKRIPLRKRLGG
jgi:hypothetical protein